MSFGVRLLLFLILTLPLVTSSGRNTPVSGIGKTGVAKRLLMVSIEDYGDPSANTRHDPSVPTNAKADTTP
ncbi:hypothetical protein HID58_022368 [Brassica napus]|uniref:(rape) hypothetical protein n=1 Tax=Brassica napus TaxID=3708 RepID=A0A816SHA5_BRANA|nr:protein PSY2-like [Brassica napus]KAH0922350.1 hypothetical protein HID58_022368 [Brassica napus]CAF2085468.1 unnamed protein product [Brassica napus]